MRARRLGTLRPSREGGMTMIYQVRIDGELVPVDVLQTANTVWEASGEFEGRLVTVTGRSRNAVIDHWRTVALRQAD